MWDEMSSHDIAGEVMMGRAREEREERRKRREGDLIRRGHDAGAA